MQGWPLSTSAANLSAMHGLNLDYAALGVILVAALFFFWTQKLRTDLTALLVTLALILPWSHPDGHWRSILTYQEGFSGFGSVAVIMVTAMFSSTSAIAQVSTRIAARTIRATSRARSNSSW